MGKARDDAGNIWETDAQGHPVRLISAGSSSGALTDPRLGPQVTKAQNDAAASQYAPGTAAADLKIKDAQAANAAAVAGAQRDQAVAEAQKAGIELQKIKLGSQLDPEKRKAIEALQSQLDHVTELWSQDLRGGLPNPVFGHIPTGTNKGFDSAAQGLVNPFQSAFRIPGVGAQSDTELRQFQQGGVPNATDTDKEIKEKIGNLQRRIDFELGRGQSITGSNPLPPITPPGAGDDQIGLATGKTRSQVDPVLKAVGSRVGHMLSSGAPAADILKFLKDSGVDPASTDIGAKLQYRGTDDFKRWQRANPGAAYPIGPSFYTKQVPMTGARSLFNKGSQSGPVGATEAGIVASANALTGDRGASLIGALSGDPEAAKTGMQLLRTNHQAASLGGDIAGQALFEGALGRVPGAHALMASRRGRRGADALYGGYYGSGDDSGDDPMTGGAGGAATNMLGGMFGRGIQKSVGGLATGVTNPTLQYLDNAGVPLTIGQIGHGSSNTMGHMIGGIEDRLAGLPGSDAVINTARHRGAVGFNRAAFKEGGGTGATGSAGLDEVSTLRGNAYNFLNPLDIPLDAPFAGSQAGVRAAIPAMPAFGPEVGKGLDQIDRVSAGGNISGRDWQSALRDTKANRSSIAGQPFANDATGALRDVENNLQQLAARQGPPGTIDNLNSANKIHAQVETLASALDNGPTQKAGQLFTPGRLDDVSRVGARKFGGRLASLTGANRPFYDLTQAGNEVLPNVVKDSGTAGRMMLVPMMTGALGSGVGAATDGNDRLGGSSEGAKYGALVGLMAAGPYSKAGQKIIQKALLGDRSDRIVKIGQFLINRAKLGGMFGAGGARDYVYQPELPR